MRFRGKCRAMVIAGVSVMVATMVLAFGAAGSVYNPFWIALRCDTRPTAVAIGDLNQDGIPDLVIGASGNVNYVDVLLGRGKGAFAPYVSYQAGGPIIALAIGDINKDGKPDVVDLNSNQMDVYLGLGGGALDFTGLPPIGTDFFYSMRLTDLDGDGDLDILLGGTPSANTTEYVVRRNDGTGHFPATTYYPLSASPALNDIHEFVLADLDGDGREDVATARQFYPVDPTTGIQDNPETWFTGPNYTQGIGRADIDHDGSPDIATVSTNQIFDGFSLKVQQLVASRSATGSVHLAPAGPYLTYFSYQIGHFTLADADRDGFPDLEYANANSNKLTVWQGLGNFQFGAAIDSIPFPGTELMVAGDLNGDGRADLIQAPPFADYADHVNVLLSLFLTLDVPEPPARRVALAAPVPNPARDGVRLAVRDITGRVVRTLVAGVEPAGRHDVPWDGTDAGNRSVAPGLYFVDLAAAGSRETRRILVVH